MQTKFLKKINQKKPKGTIIFFHGIFSDADGCKPLENIAKGIGYDYLAYNMKMHGNNRLEKNEDFDFYGNVDDAIEVVKQARTKDIIICGHSAGGAYVLKCIEHFGGEYFKRIILISPLNNSFSFISKNKINTSRKILKDITKIIKDKNLSELQKKYVEEGGFNISQFKLWEIPNYIHFVKSLVSREFLSNTSVAFEKIKKPILLLVGRDDVVIDSLNTIYLFNTLNNKYLNYILADDVAHFPHFQYKDFDAQVINFIKNGNIKKS